MENQNDVVIDLGDVMVETRGPLNVGIPDIFTGYYLPGLGISED